MPILDWLKSQKITIPIIGFVAEQQEFSFITDAKCYNHFGREHNSFYKARHV